MQVVKIKGEVDSDGTLRLSLPTQLPSGPAEAVVVVDSPPTPANGHNYDFTDLAGKLIWKGDPVASQRKLRNEW